MLHEPSAAGPLTRASREAFVPLHLPPGHTQTDFGEAVVEEVGGSCSFERAKAETSYQVLKAPDGLVSLQMKPEA